jgi:hypothetical protein
LSKTGKLVTGCLHNRSEQTKIWDALSADQLADAINQIVTKESRLKDKGKIVPIKYVRFQESGDFRNQADVDKMSRIASLLKVPSYTYTARRDLNYDRVSPKLTINGSGFMVHNDFHVVAEIKPGPHCRGIKGGGCMGCPFCKQRRGVVIQEMLRSASKKSLADLKAGILPKGDEHGGVESEIANDASQILELGPSAMSVKITSKGKKSWRKTASRDYPELMPSVRGMR